MVWDLAPYDISIMEYPIDRLVDTEKQQKIAGAASLGERRLDALPQFVGHVPITVSHSVLALGCIGIHQAGPCGGEFLPTGCHQKA